MQSDQMPEQQNANPYQSPNPSPNHAGPWTCPVCQTETRNLKRYEVIDSAWFFVLFAHLTPMYYAACPECMRAILTRKCFANLLSANILWLLWLLPRTLLQIMATFIPGPSREVTRRKVEAVEPSHIPIM